MLILSSRIDEKWFFQNRKIILFALFCSIKILSPVITAALLCILVPLKINCRGFCFWMAFWASGFVADWFWIFGICYRTSRVKTGIRFKWGEVVSKFGKSKWRWCPKFGDWWSGFISTGNFQNKCLTWWYSSFYRFLCILDWWWTSSLVNTGKAVFIVRYTKWWDCSP